MKKSILATLIAAFAVATTFPAQASGSQTVTYVAGTVVASAAGVGGVHPLGGFTVSVDEPTFRVDVSDLAVAGGSLYISICQENEIDAASGDTNFCGDGQDDVDMYSGCTNPVGGGAVMSRISIGSNHPFIQGEPIGFFLFADPVTCPFPAVAGTATVTWPKGA